jgi:hypothetical protein
MATPKSEATISLQQKTKKLQTKIEKQEHEILKLQTKILKQQQIIIKQQTEIRKLKERPSLTHLAIELEKKLHKTS